MVKKPFIFKDGELILKKPIKQSEVPNPPERASSNIPIKMIWSFIGILLILVLVIAFASNISWTTAKKVDKLDDMIVTFNHTKKGLSQQEFIVTIKQEEIRINKRKVNFNIILQELNYDINNAKDSLQLFEFKDNEWVEVKSKLFYNKTKEKYKETHEKITIPKYDQGEIKYKVIVKTPLSDNGNGWGSKGLLVFSLDGNEFWDKTHSSWWDVSWKRRRPIVIDANQTLTNEPLLVKLTGIGLDTGNCSQELLITDEDNQQLKRRVIWQNSSNGFYDCWAYIPVNHSNSGNETYFAYYNNSGATEVNDDPIAWNVENTSHFFVDSNDDEDWKIGVQPSQISGIDRWNLSNKISGFEGLTRLVQSQTSTDPVRIRGWPFNFTGQVVTIELTTNWSKHDDCAISWEHYDNIGESFGAFKTNSSDIMLDNDPAGTNGDETTISISSVGEPVQVRAIIREGDDRALWVNPGQSDQQYIDIADGYNASTVEEGVLMFTNNCDADLHIQYSSWLFSQEARNPIVSYTVGEVEVNAPDINNNFPLNGSTTITRNVNFTYNVTNTGLIVDSCTLLLNDLTNETDTTITQTINQSFNITLNNTHTINWKVQCENNQTDKRNSSEFTLFFNNAPTTPTTLAPNNNTILVKPSINLTCADATDDQLDTLNYEFWNGTDVDNLRIAQNTTATTYNLTFSINPPSHQYWTCRANDNIEHSGNTSIRKITYVELYPNCSVVNDTSAIAYNFSFAAENNSIVSDVSFNGDITYWGSSRDLNKTVSFIDSVNSTSYCISPKNTTINLNTLISYEKTGWALRNYNLRDITATGNSTDITLYLLPNGEGLFVTFQIINSAGQPLVNVLFTAERTIAGEFNLIYSQLTDDAGTVVPFLDPDISHRFTFEKTGFDIFTTILTPSQTTYTITLGETAEAVNETIPSRGILFNILPTNSTLNNNTKFNFTFNISSSFYVLDNAGFTLTNSTGDTLNSTTCTGATGCITSVILNTRNNSNVITMNYFWTINGTQFNAGQRNWFVYATYQGGYSIMKIFEDAEKLGSGFGDFTKSIISFLIIISVVGVAVLKFSLNAYSEGAVLFLIAVLTAALDYVGFLPSIPQSVPHFIPIMMFIISIGYIIFELKR